MSSQPPDESPVEITETEEGSFNIQIDFWRGLLQTAPFSVRVVLRTLAGVSIGTALLVAAFVRDPIGFIERAIFELFGAPTLALLRDPLGTIQGAIVSFFIDWLIRPILDGIIWVALRILAVLTWIVFGSDGRVGTVPNVEDSVVGPFVGTPGVADLLFVVVQVGGEPFGVTADAVVGFFGQVEAGIQAGTQPLGPFAPVAAAGAGIGLLAVSGYAIWASIPLLSPRLAIAVNLLLTPFRLLLRAFGLDRG